MSNYAEKLKTTSELVEGDGEQSVRLSSHMQTEKMFDGLQPEKAKRAKQPTPPRVPPKLTWRHFSLAGITVVAGVVIFGLWQSAKFDGDECISMGKKTEALAAYDRDAREEENKTQPDLKHHLSLAEIYIKDKRFDDADRLLQRAQTALDRAGNQHLYLQDHRVHFLQGRVEFARGQYSQALANFMGGNVDQDETIIALIITNSNLGREAEVNRWIAAWRKTDRRNEAEPILASTLLAAGRIAEAKTELQQNLKDMPEYNHESIKDRLGDIAFIEHDYPAALKYYTNGQDLQTASSYYPCQKLDKLAQLCRLLNMPEQAESCIDHMNKVHAAKERDRRDNTSQYGYGNYFGYRTQENQLIKNALELRFPFLIHHGCNE